MQIWIVDKYQKTVEIIKLFILQKNRWEQTRVKKTGLPLFCLWILDKKFEWP